MVEKIWFENHPFKYLLWPLLWPLSLLFGVISRRKKQAYLLGKKTAYRAPVPVVVVGNITAGGNGKTPVVVWLVEALQQQGFKPGVVSRGYGAKASSYPLLVDETTLTAHCGDEPKLIFQRTGALVAVDPNRPQAVKALLSQGVDVIITDDGLQHYALQRDVEIVVVDGQRRFGSEQLIPLGPLREPISRLLSVDFVITNGGKAKPDEIGMTLAPGKAINLLTGEQVEVQSLAALVAFAGIGHPPRFFATLEQLGAKLVATQEFADHQDFEQKALEKLVIQGENVIMTEKDAVKCRQFAQKNWWYLPVSAQFDLHKEQQILQRITEVIRKYGSPSA
ncbi:tetraacyldisaccharide 4'-kinase [Vibrio navarrensis]|uniref:tetraacyldisaccharide 4'-kinase n=1 Tax=Vibrio navarrensis TaxID=29495 RepID=UPI0013024613|nr:tetraacyldisaccharide 4'-kinase [Vibrio navarrensis]MBE4617203.1 tetraacyldisaccharide 4'-kinase [Vibrio navarrensis]